MHLSAPAHHIADLIYDGHYGKVYEATRVSCLPQAPRTDVITVDYLQGYLHPTAPNVVLKVRTDWRDIEQFQVEAKALLALQKVSPDAFLKAHYAQLHLSNADGKLVTQYVICLERAYETSDRARKWVTEEHKEAFCLRFTADIAKAIDTLHDANYIHGDIKPDNIFLVSDAYDSALDEAQAFAQYTGGSSTFRMVLGDFDTIQKADSFTDVHVGTKYYKAPELVMKIPCTSAVDVWSLCVSIYEMRTGSVLFGIDDQTPTESESSASSDSRDFQEDAAQRAIDELAQLESIIRVVGAVPVGCPVSAFHAAHSPRCSTCDYKLRAVSIHSAPLTFTGGSLAPCDSTNTDHPRYPAQLDSWWSALCSEGLQFDPKKRCSAKAIYEKVRSRTASGLNE